MLAALVIGRTHGTLKHESLHGMKMLVVQPLMADQRSPDGPPLVVVDGLGAGLGEKVMITSDGRGARELLRAENTPVRWTTAGIIDE